MLSVIAWWLVIIGGLNWLLIGALQHDVVSLIFGDGSMLSRLIFVLVGLSALWLLWEKFAGSSGKK